MLKANFEIAESSTTNNPFCQPDKTNNNTIDTMNNEEPDRQIQYNMQQQTLYPVTIQASTTLPR